MVCGLVLPVTQKNTLAGIVWPLAGFSVVLGGHVGAVGAVFVGGGFTLRRFNFTLIVGRGSERGVTCRICCAYVTR